MAQRMAQRMARSRATTLAAVALAGLLAFVAPTTANHGQTDGGRIIAFDHVTGNEWWVEVALSGQDSGSVLSVEAQDTNGAWTTLTKKSWGPYAASFHIEPGNQVRFRASWAGGAQSVSCWFTHPGGVEQCALPPSGWVANAVGDGGIPSGGDIAIGDGDQDGRDEVYVANAAGLWQFQWTSNGWTRFPVVQDFAAYSRVALGDLTGDGKDELVASWDYDNHSNVDLYEWNGQTWEAWNFVQTPVGQPASDLMIADVEAGGNAELYIASAGAASGTIQQVQSGSPGAWGSRNAAGFDAGVRALAAADVDDNGDLEIYAGVTSDTRGDVYRMDIASPGAPTQLNVVYQRSIPLTSLDAGDLDADGRDDLMVTHATPTYGDVKWLRSTGSGPFSEWSMLLSNGARPTDVTVGDADNAGGKEAYVMGNDGQLYRMRWSGSTLVTDVLLGNLQPGLSTVLGDGDADGLLELYGSARTTNGNPIVQVTNHPPGPKPPPAWDESLIGDAGSRESQVDLALGDGDRDGRREIYAAGDGLYQFKWTGTAWQRTTLSSNVFQALAVGDGDRDGKPEVYAAGANPAGGYEVRRFVFNGAWSSTAIFGSASPVGTMTLGDVDDDGTTELYIVMMPEYYSETGSMPSYQLEFEGGGWQSRYIANLEGGAHSSWVGDADRDGDRDLYVVGSGVYRLDITTGGAGSVAFIGGDTPEDPVYLSGIVAADGDRDGQQEVYVGFSEADGGPDNGLLRFSVGPGGWERQRILLPGFVAPNDLAFGDVDNDGLNEVYAGGYDGALWRITGSPAAGWTKRSMVDIGPEFIDALVLGDADGDGKTEAYMATSDSGRSPPQNVYRVAPVPPPAGTTAFDATFTGVRGNEWWEQVSVAASGGTLSKVDVRFNDGAWQPLTKQSWGGYAASYRAVQGTTLQFRATATSAATDLSDCYRWIPAANTDATKVTCGTTPPPPPPSGFDASFTGVKGNEWWVQASVSGNQPIQNVAARINCSEEWRSLTKQSYGWSASFHVPAGSKVDFRATSTTGNMDFSGGYIWPQATPTGAC